VYDVDAVDIDDSHAQLDCKADGSDPELTLILIDTDGQRHELVLQAAALMKFVKIVRAIQADVPGLLGGH
jgi:hypothetical protein